MIVDNIFLGNFQNGSTIKVKVGLNRFDLFLVFTKIEIRQKVNVAFGQQKFVKEEKANNRNGNGN